MDDDGHAGAFCRQPAKNSGLAAVCVNHVRCLIAEDGFQFSQCKEILQRVYRADEFGNYREQPRNYFSLPLRVNLPGRSSGRKEVDFDAGFLAEAQNGGDGIFLRAADDEPRDDMCDFQIVDQLNS